MSNPAAGAVTGYQGTFHGQAGEVARVRREIAAYLADCPARDDLVLIADELAANCVLHTRSRGELFHVRCELSGGSARIEAEDMGGPWRRRTDDGRPHGLDIIEALTGEGGWGPRSRPTRPASSGPGSNGESSHDGRPSRAGLLPRAVPARPGGPRAVAREHHHHHG